ncbi:MAG: hypothetical protein ACRC0B_01890 [Legionella sp.]
MTDLQLGDQVWILNIELEDEFYLLAKQTVTEILEDSVECEDDFNTFHVAYEDIFRKKADALDAMIERLNALRSEC